MRKRWFLSICLLFRLTAKTTEPVGLKLYTKIDLELVQHRGLFFYLKSLSLKILLKEGEGVVQLYPRLGFQDDWSYFGHQF